MSRKKAPQATPFQLAYERVLRISMLLLGTFHMLLSFARHFFSPENQIFYSPVVKISVKAEQWFAVALLVCAIMYLILLKTPFRPKRTLALHALFRLLEDNLSDSDATHNAGVQGRIYLAS